MQTGGDVTYYVSATARSYDHRSSKNKMLLPDLTVKGDKSYDRPSARG